MHDNAGTVSPRARIYCEYNTLMCQNVSKLVCTKSTDHYSRISSDVMSSNVSKYNPTEAITSKPLFLYKLPDIKLVMGVSSLTK